jgi:hypothetical protein
MLGEHYKTECLFCDSSNRSRESGSISNTLYAPTVAPDAARFNRRLTAGQSRNPTARRGQTSSSKARTTLGAADAICPFQTRERGAARPLGLTARRDARFCVLGNVGCRNGAGGDAGEAVTARSYIPGRLTVSCFSQGSPYPGRISGR